MVLMPPIQGIGNRREEIAPEKATILLNEGPHKIGSAFKGVAKAEYKGYQVTNEIR